MIGRFLGVVTRAALVLSCLNAFGRNASADWVSLTGYYDGNQCSLHARAEFGAYFYCGQPTPSSLGFRVYGGAPSDAGGTLVNAYAFGCQEYETWDDWNPIVRNFDLAVPVAWQNSGLYLEMWVNNGTGFWYRVGSATGPLTAFSSIHPLKSISEWEAVYPPPIPLLAQAFEAGADPATCSGVVDMVDLDPFMSAAVTAFASAVAATGAPYTFKVTSAYRPPAYQAHLHEIRSRFRDLLRAGGLRPVVTNGRPQLQVTDSSKVACAGLVDEINREIVKHCLVPGRGPNHLPSVNGPGHSLHEVGRAIDIQVLGIPDVLIDRLAWWAGLHRPCKSSDPVHYQLKMDRNCSQ